MKKSKVILYLVASVFLLVTGCSKKDKVEPEGVSTLEKIEGVWEGVINVPNQPLPISLKFQESNGMISIPAQGLDDYPLTSVVLKDSSLFIDMNIQGQLLTFEGLINKEIITGTFKQAGQSFPFELTKGEANEVAEEGEFIQIEVQGKTMIGQLETPQGEGPFPIMIILAGSGPTDKDGNSILLPGKNNSLKMLAEDLAEQGVASIRYDKRGVGKNMTLAGKEEELRFEHYINDAAAWIEFAKEDNNYSKVGVIGHSEGSLIGMVAAEKTDADAFVSIAGAGREIDQVPLEQLAEQLPANLNDEAKRIVENLKQGEQVKTVSTELQSIFRPSVQPYMISWLKYNPQERLKNFNGPTLIVNGTHDIQVGISDAESLHNAKKDSLLLIIENMNHVFKDASKDLEENIKTYSDPALPLSKGLIEGLINFLKEAAILQN